ncbi:lysostaphin resistance A-like protein [Rhodococcus ruber]|uniref:lysostaphin resistance A-like protein n=1 Tax=Rhodococcus ruber TaxID=1830 RepID=UPI003782E7BF
MTAPEPPDPGTAAAPALPAPSRPAHRWGIPAALAVLAVNLVGFTLGPILAGEGFVAETYVLAIMAPTLLAGATALAFSVWRGCGPVADFGLPRSWAEFRDQLGVGLLGGGIALLGALILAAILVVALGIDAADSPLTALVGLPTGWKLLLVAWVWFGAPLGEELMFRGMLWGALERRPDRWWGRPIGVLTITTVVFAVWHQEWWRLPVLLWGGAAMGFARLRGRSVFSSWVAHSLNNTLPALGLLLLL